MQRGQIFQRSGAWYVRFYEDGRRVTKHLGYVKDYPSKRSVEPVAHDLMRGVNSSAAPAVTLEEFIRERYLPHARTELRPSVANGYEKLYTAYVVGRAECGHRVREYTTAMCQELMNSIAEDRVLAKSTLQHVKFFFSGVFVYAAQCGVREGNPMRETRVPRRAKPVGETHAYTLLEILKMLLVLPPQLKAAVATAGFAGLRLAELHGLEWTDYDGRDLVVRRSAWRGHVSDPKSKRSGRTVPVIPQLRVILDEWREECCKRAQPARIFGPLDYATRWNLREALHRMEMPWWGWHALRRGLASNLFDLGVDDLIVQRILGHASVSVTREHYIKVRDPKVDEAMEALSRAVGFGPDLAQTDGKVN